MRQNVSWVILTGLWAGSLVGLAEAALVLATSSPPEEYGIWLFAFVSYALMGASVALLSVPWTLRRAPRRAATLGAFLGSAPLVFVVGRYYVAQRIFGEQLPVWSASGMFAHGLLLLGALVLAGAVAWLFGRLADKGGRRAAPLLLLAWLALGGLVAAGVQVATPRAPEIVRSATAGPERPNLILVVIDTLRADALGVYGGGPQASPRIDALGREGVVFQHAYAQSSWTRPSIATILTGLYPSEHGAVRKLDPLPDHVDTLAEFLQRRGYWTAAFVTNINVAPIFNFDQGFGEYHYLAPSFYFGATDSATRLASYKILRLLRERIWKNRIFYQHYYQDAAVVTDAVRRWLAEKPPQPFFLLVHYMDPHDPYFETPYNGHGIARVANPSPPPALAPEMRRLYAEDVAYLDQHFGELVEAWRKSGLLEKTWIVLTADHGEEFFEHGGWWHGTTLYEEQVRVPFVVRPPGGAATPTIRTDVALTVDLFPTVVQALGYTPPTQLRGVNLLAGPAPADRVVFAEEELEGNQLAMIRQGREKLILANPGNPRRLPEVVLFDLEEDPLEQNNLAPQQEQRVRELRAALEAFRIGLRKADGRVGLGQ